MGVTGAVEVEVTDVTAGVTVGARVGAKVGTGVGEAAGDAEGKGTGVGEGCFVTAGRAVVDAAGVGDGSIHITELTVVASGRSVELTAGEQAVTNTSGSNATNQDTA